MTPFCLESRCPALFLTTDQLKNSPLEGLPPLLVPTQEMRRRPPSEIHVTCSPTLLLPWTRGSALRPLRVRIEDFPSGVFKVFPLSLFASKGVSNAEFKNEFSPIGEL